MDSFIFLPACHSNPCPRVVTSGRLLSHCKRLGIALPEGGLANQIHVALAKFQIPGDVLATAAAATTGATVPAGQGLLRLEWTAAGVLNVSTRIVPAARDKTQLTAITVRAPCWPEMKLARGAKHGAWAPYIDAMHEAR